jgi:hypothetical protein
MSYIIKNADGSILLNLVDGTVDKKTTSLTLIGRNTDAYGTALNTNLVNLMQNFASTSQPRSPLVGQLWYDVSSGRLKVFNLDGVFGEISAALLSNSKPVLLKQGDLWIDTLNEQLYFTKDGTNTILAGPIYSAVNGKSGWIMEKVTDSNDNERVVSGLYSNNTLLGILSTSSFELAGSNRIGGMQYITVGLTLNETINGIRFAGTSKNTDEVGTFTPQSYLLRDNAGQEQTIVGTGDLALLSDAGLIVGQYRDFSVFAGGNGSPGGARGVGLRNAIVNGSTNFITIKSYGTGTNREDVSLSLRGDQVGINTPSPSYNLHVEGTGYFSQDLIVNGGLYVLGTSTVVQTQTLEIFDKQIELGVPPPGGGNNDITADGGGIVLRGDGSKEILYSRATASWTSNLHFNLSSTVTNNLSYKISGLTVLTSSTLGSSVVNSSIRTLGVLTALTVTNVIIKGNGFEGTTSSYSIASASSTATGIGSVVTYNLSSNVPILNSGTTVSVVGVTGDGYNGVFDINSVVSRSSFTVIAVSTLSSTTAVMGANPLATFNDLMLSSAGGNIDATKKRIKNVQYSTVPTDAATVQFAIDAGSVQSLKGFIVTLDVTSMSNPDSEIAIILTALAPPVNAIPVEYQNDYQYDLPIGYRARVLCQTNTIPVPAEPINVSRSNTLVQSYPDGTSVSALTNVQVTSVGVQTTATFSYTIKEFRVIGGTPPLWQFYRNITL